MSAVRLEIVSRIIGAADHTHVVFLEEAFGGGESARAQKLVAMVVDLARNVIGTQNLAARRPEGEPQLEVGPVVERIAQRVGHGLRPSSNFSRPAPRR